MNDKLNEALDHISDRHIAEAAAQLLQIDLDVCHCADNVRHIALTLHCQSHFKRAVFCALRRIYPQRNTKQCAKHHRNSQLLLNPFFHLGLRHTAKL